MSFEDEFEPESDYEYEEDEEERKGGFNPIFLAAALIILTVLIAATLSFLATDMFKKEPSPDSGKCTGGISLYSGVYDVDEKTLVIIVKNQDTRLGGLKLRLLSGQELLKEMEIREVLEPSSLQTISINDLELEFINGELKTECPNINLVFTNEDGVLS